MAAMAAVAVAAMAYSGNCHGSAEGKGEIDEIHGR